ncbi:related to phenol 2-monooxygenase [Ceraceosorus bombacis]|uniref:Related to phenol 2-monooxygenase n=1 Tax=Ceraceosorus bombacis TaxID=401625 RepID=A0A0P1BG19_9BASI|nr:related to phenol 2-monooxygenase [Ceraceosorus bombacis]
MSTIEQTKDGGRRAHGTHDYPTPLPSIDKDVWDVIIIGAGPAGLMTATSLARFGGLDVLVVDERSEPTTAGRADGIQPRTIEVLKNMEPLGSDFVARSAASYERTFWGPQPGNETVIARNKRVQSFPTNMEIEDNCTLGLQQGLIECGFLKDMERHGLRVTRPWRFRNFEMTDDRQRPVTVTLEKTRGVVQTKNAAGQPDFSITGTGQLKSLRTKYLVGCDGGRSGVRKNMETEHGVVFESAGIIDTLWSALDCVVETNFPDVRKIATIHSKAHGALYIFPREDNEAGEPIIRCYTQVNRLGGKKSGESAFEAKDKVTSNMVMEAIQKIAHPYRFDFKTVEWFTCYPIGQRLVSRYSLPAGSTANGSAFSPHHVFLVGDACHTHSPKAGQGMNTAIIDAQALAWRINLVEKGLAEHDALLSTYHSERWATGNQLITFDAEYAALFSGEIPASKPELGKLNESELEEYFVKVQRRNAAFTTGAGVTYSDNALNFRDARPLGVRNISHRLEAGARLQPAWATRFINSQAVRIIHEIQYTAPGGFRLYVLAGDPQRNRARLHAFIKHLQSSQSFLQRFVPKKRRDLAQGAYHQRPRALNTGLFNGLSHEANPFFHLLLIMRQSRFDFELTDLDHLGPLRALVYADDVEQGGDLQRGEDGAATVGGLHRKWLGPQTEDSGAVVVVRPDGYVGAVLGLDQAPAIETYFDGFLRAENSQAAHDHHHAHPPSRL